MLGFGQSLEIPSDALLWCFQAWAVVYIGFLLNASGFPGLYIGHEDSDGMPCRAVLHLSPLSLLSTARILTLFVPRY